MKRYKAAMAIVSLVICLMMVAPSTVRAWDAHDYMAAPCGTHMLFWYFQSISAVQNYADNKRSTDIDVHATVGILRPVIFTKIPGTNIIADPQFLLPFGYQFASTTTTTDTGEGIVTSSVNLPGSSGLGDLILACTFWFVNDPANKQWFGITPYIYVPTGDYDSGRLVNLGANRWGGRLEAGYIKGWGDWTMDFGGGIEGYTNNNRYDGDCTLKQDPVFDIQAKLTYDISKSAYFGLEYSFIVGGKTQVNDDPKSPEPQAQTLKFTSGFWFASNYQLQAGYNMTLDQHNGSKVNTYQFRFLYIY
jgi:hypothetical protein